MEAQPDECEGKGDQDPGSPRRPTLFSGCGPAADLEGSGGERGRPADVGCGKGSPTCDQQIEALGQLVPVLQVVLTGYSQQQGQNGQQGPDQSGVHGNRTPKGVCGGLQRQFSPGW